MKTCSISGCELPSYCRGFCSSHYKRWQVGLPVDGPIHPKKRGTLEERFWRYVEKAADCWNWTGSISSQGYGYIVAEGGRGSPRLMAHRVAYEISRGPIPFGLQIDHLCRNRGCVNPEHLEPVTSRENTMRGLSPAALAAKRDLCLHGHPLDGVIVREDRRLRYCKACNRARARSNAARRKQASP